MEPVRIQDDLYNHVNGEWLEQAVIPDDKPTTGGFQDLADEVERILIADLNAMNETGSYPDVYMERACALYRAALDTRRRNREGIRPALPVLARIRKLTGVSHFNRNLKDMVIEGFPLPFELGVEADMMDTDRHCVMIQGPQTILPDTTYYKVPEQKEAMLALYAQAASAVLAKTRLSEADRAAYLADTLKFDGRIAELVKSSEEWSDYASMYNPMKTRTVSAMLKPVKFRKLLTDLFGTAPETVIVAEPRYMKAFTSVFNEETFEEYKHWAYVKALMNAAGSLSESLREMGGRFHRALMGVAKPLSVEKFAFQTASALFSEPVGLYYGRKYFGEEAKKDITDLVLRVIDKYKERIRTNAILSEETKEKAVRKLSAITVNMGYPDRVRAMYDKLVFNPEDSLYTILLTLRRARTEDAFSKLYEPVDRTIWGMPGHMVNASYNPFQNSITFPAAILQPPFYSVRQSRSRNLGGIGAVIGHEISHAFDNNGAKFDEKGNMKNWWTTADRKNFERRTKAMIREFEGIELPWGKVNSTLIVSENIADNGGMAVTLDIMKDTPEASFEEYFENWARVWCMKAKPEYQQILLRVDVHAPNLLRANMQPRNFSEWYETYGVTKKDKMYIAPQKRVIIW